MLVFFRVFSAFFLLLAALAAVHDGTRWLAGGLATTSLLEHWKALAPTLLAATQSAIQRSTHPMVWDAGIGKLLLLPAWAALAGLGLLLAYAGRRRRRVNVFAN